MKPAAHVTIAVPSFNQGKYLGSALKSIFSVDVPVEVFVVDGGSTDDSLQVIEDWSEKLSGWRSCQDGGQAAAINEAVAEGSAPYVCWLNSDDRLLRGGLEKLLDALETMEKAPAAYGKVLNDKRGRITPVSVEAFDIQRLAGRCIISQPGTVIRRTAWEQVGGLKEALVMAMDYDLWWRLYKACGPLLYVPVLVAVNTDHVDAKTSRFRRLHYSEAMSVVRKYHGKLPITWWLKYPYSVVWRGVISSLRRRMNGPVSFN